jgi:hypothetical protein
MRDVMKHLGSIHDGDSLEDLIELSTCGHSVEIRFFGWINDEKYWLREIVGVGERILPADCFGNPILSKERD